MESDGDPRTPHLGYFVRQDWTCEGLEAVGSRRTLCGVYLDK